MLGFNRGYSRRVGPHHRPIVFSQCLEVLRIDPAGYRRRARTSRALGAVISLSAGISYDLTISGQI